MATTKGDVKSGFESVSNFLGTVGATIKENERQTKLSKVMQEFKDPNKVFMNPDGTPKSDAEITPKITEGIMQFYQLGEDKLANGLMSYYTNMSKSFDKDAQNNFMYNYSKGSSYFPKDEAGAPIQQSDRVDYSKVAQDKQFAPLQPKSRFSFQRVDLPGPDGSGVVKYYKVDKVSGEAFEIDGSEYTKEIKESHYSGTNVNINVPQAGIGYIKDKDGKLLGQTEIKGGKILHNGKWISAEEFNKNTGNVVEQTSTGFSELQNKGNPKQTFEDIKKQINNTLGEYEITELPPEAKQQALDYIEGRSTVYPEFLYNKGLESTLNQARQFYMDNLYNK